MTSHLSIASRLCSTFVVPFGPPTFHHSAAAAVVNIQQSFRHRQATARASAQLSSPDSLQSSPTGPNRKPYVSGRNDSGTNEPYDTPSSRDRPKKPDKASTASASRLGTLPIKPWVRYIGWVDDLTKEATAYMLLGESLSVVSLDQVITHMSPVACRSHLLDGRDC